MRRRPEAIDLVRVAVALLLAVHGWSRLLSGGVAGFGQWLASLGLPAATAWLITFFEIGSTLLLLLNRFTRILPLGHVVILSAGIALVHARNGWFVVGGGTNGVEYSVLLIACLAAVWLDAVYRERAARATSPR